MENIGGTRRIQKCVISSTGILYLCKLDLLTKLDVGQCPLTGRYSLCVSYVFAFLDRSNIGNAKTAGMDKDLHIQDEGSNSQYQWLLTIFYIPYILFQAGVLGYKLFPPSKWMGSAVVAWGCIAILQAAAFNWSGLMAARFFIGATEACFGYVDTLDWVKEKNANSIFFFSPPSVLVLLCIFPFSFLEEKLDFALLGSLSVQLLLLPLQEV